MPSASYWQTALTWASEFCTVCFTYTATSRPVPGSLCEASYPPRCCCWRLALAPSSQRSLRYSLLLLFCFRTSAEIFASSLTCLFSQGVFCCDRGWNMRFIHVSVGTVCLLGVFAAVLRTESQLVHFVRTQFLPRYTKKRT